MRLSHRPHERDTLRRCSRCVLPETYPRITFGESNICNWCRREEHNKREPLGREALRELVDRHRRHDGRYDSLVALSGGRDSAFALYWAVEELKLTPLAFTIDNGFIPDEAWESIKNATENLGVDHVVVRHTLLARSIRSMLGAWLRHPSASMVALMCLGCRLGMRKGFLEIARTYPFPLCISGAGEPENSFATAFFSTSSSSLKRMLAMAAGMSMEMLRNPRYLRNPSILCRIVAEFLYEYPPLGAIRRMVSPKWKYVPLFHYLAYDERLIQRIITSKLGWRKYHYSHSSWRADCKINLLRNALYKQTLGFTKHDELISGLIRLGAMTRNEGLLRLERDNHVPEEFLKEFFAEVGLEQQRLP